MLPDDFCFQVFLGLFSATLADGIEPGLALKFRQTQNPTCFAFASVLLYIYLLLHLFNLKHPSLIHPLW